MSLAENFALNVRRLRNSRGWSQEELADRAGYSRQYVSYLETSRQMATLESLERIAKAFGVAAGEMLERPPKGSRT